MTRSPLPSTPTHVVGIGASAGGLDALEKVFTCLPGDTGMAFVVVQHLSPDHKSFMVELLSKRTEMPVTRATSGMRVEADQIYLIPPGKNLTIFHGELLTSDPQPRGLNLPIDVFLRSLSEDLGEHSVAIILSGTGSDGTRGVRAIKQEGGMVMVQDPKTARFDGMPRSAVSTGLADFVLPPEEIPEQLVAYASHPYVSRPESGESLLTADQGLSHIFAALRDTCKLDFTDYKPTTVHRRIERRMSVNGVADIYDYVAFIRRHPSEVTSLYKELLIGVTSFMRDPHIFADLQEKWLPELLSRTSDAEVRVWSAGCSTGEEAYTLAILVREALERLGIARDVKVFATDVDRDALRRAGVGVFPESIAADLPPHLLAKYFYHQDEHYRITRSIREMVVFAQHNLIQDPPFTRIDLLSCRNLLIYLQPVLQQQVLQLFSFALREGGLLLLGSSETTGDQGEHFEPLSHKHRIYRSRGSGRPVTSMQTDSSRLDALGSSYSPKFASAPSARRGPSDRERVQERLLEGLAGDYVPLTLVVNPHMQIVQVLGDTGGYFKLPSGRVLNDISRMASKDLSIPLTTGIQRVLRTGKEARFSNIRLHHLGDGRVVHLRIKPLPGRKGQEPLLAVFLQEEEREALPSIESVEYNLDAEADQLIRDLEHELQFTRENLQATIEELETANEELQATNEELLAANEELQATNEELQSTNEELQTVNAEYQRKIIELTELNNDVENLLAAAPVGTLILDENLEVRRFSSRVTPLFHLLDTDVGRPLTHINHELGSFDPVAVVKRVMKTSREEEHEVHNRAGRVYLMRVLPYLVGPKSFAGVQISAVDVTRLREAQQLLATSRGHLQRAAQLASVGSWSFDNRTQVHWWSEEVFRIHGLEPADQPPPPEEGIAYYIPEHQPLIAEAFTRALQHGESYDLTLQIRDTQGRARWIHTIAGPELEDGEVVRVVGAFQDITDIYQAESRYEQLVEHLSQGVVVYRAVEEGEDFVFVSVNGAVEEIEGLTRQDLVGRRLTDCFPGVAEMGLLEALGRVWRTGEAEQLPSTRYEDDRLSGWRENNLYRLPTGEIVAVYSKCTP